MTVNELLERVITDGIAAAVADYDRADEEDKRDGSVRGFNDCRDKSPGELVVLWGEACRGHLDGNAVTVNTVPPSPREEHPRRGSGETGGCLSLDLIMSTNKSKSAPRKRKLSPEALQRLRRLGAVGRARNGIITLRTGAAVHVTTREPRPAA